ncbi:hypothetical protein Rhal01_02740 [Rubritalea halochordaticola]|uniref:LamG-like jellyroll fold domain-containing protein n=1 Tax=Rubritalea halochordaticola TaxID=714537 RepID=A0ABP9V1I9_9BACT
MPRHAYYLLLSGLLIASQPASAQAPEAYWSFDGGDVSARLAESYGRSALNAVEVDSSSAWNTRAGFGEVLANGFGSPYLSVPAQAAIDPGSGDFSLSVWVYRTSDDASASGIVDALDGAGTGYQFFYQGGDTLRMRLDDDQGHSVNVTTTSGQLALNAWKHLAVTVDRSANVLKFYVDGSEVTTDNGSDISSLTGSISPDQSLLISILNDTSPADGRLDDLAFFKRVLSPQEITDINANGGVPIGDLYSLAEAPSISPAKSFVKSGEPITLTSNGAGEIRYTLDGSEPDASSSLYTTPFTISESTTVKAVVIENGQLSTVTSKSYALVENSKPNILLIVADDLGFNDLGCYGAVSLATPRLDALAYQGQRYTQFTTTGPGELASQYALLTGRLPRRGAMPAEASPNTNALDSREWTLAEAMRKAGYQTSFVGVWNLGNQPGSHPNDQGFVNFYGLPWGIAQASFPPLMENGQTLHASPYPEGVLDLLTTRAESWIAEQGSDPFFMVFQPPSLPASGTSLLGDYGNRVEALDASVGKLLDKLENEGHADDTLVIFLSDGGADKNTGTFPTGSNGQQRDGKGTTWEGGVRVPMIVRWPEAVPQGSNYSTVWLPDLYVSLTELTEAYLPPEHVFDGTEQVETLLGVRAQPDLNHLLYLYRHDGSDYQLQAVRKGQWKYHQAVTVNDPDNHFSGSASLLYDLLIDPIEHVNRSSSHSSELSTLQALASDHLASLPASGTTDLPDARPEVLGPIEVLSTPGQAGEVQYQFTRPADSLNDHYVLQVSEDLTNWVDVSSGPYTVAAAGADNTEHVTVTVSVADLANGKTKYFIRLKASRP